MSEACQDCSMGAKLEEWRNGGLWGGLARGYWWGMEDGRKAKKAKKPNMTRVGKLSGQLKDVIVYNSIRFS